jgi:hypothetical protein
MSDPALEGSDSCLLALHARLGKLQIVEDVDHERALPSRSASQSVTSEKVGSLKADMSVAVAPRSVTPPGKARTDP